jgi:lipoprotein-releasing system permease protein
MNYTFWISQRLRLSGAKGSSSRVGVVIAVTGVALALIIMEFTLAIVLGFKHQIQRKLIGFDSQVTVMAPYDYITATSKPYFELTDTLSDLLKHEMPWAKSSLTLRQPGMIKTDDNFAGVFFIGRDANHDCSFEKGNIVDGEWPDFSAEESQNKVVISSTTAKALNLNVGDRIFGCYFVNDAVKSRRYEISGIYESNFGEYDATVVYASLETLQGVADLESNQGTALEIKSVSTEADVITAEADRLQDVLVNAYQKGTISEVYPVTNIVKTGAVYFNWLQLLDTNVVVIFILMLCVAGFTLISSLFIIILERIRTIGILRSLGASKRSIRHVFIHIALRLVGMGLVIGNVVGIGLLYIQESTGILPLDPQMYYLNSVPVEINPLSFILLNVGIVIVSWLILILPSHVASSVDPSKSMRYE